MSDEKNGGAVPFVVEEAAVLFVDICDSTHLYETLGDTAAFSTVRECLAALKEVVAAAGGRLVKGIGDGLMCAFPTPDSAASAACEMQSRVAAITTPRGAAIAIQIGVNFGNVLSEGDDIYGDTVNLASRMEKISVAGQIITTGYMFEKLSPAFREVSRRLGALPVKGKRNEIPIYEIMWQASSDSTMMVASHLDATPSGGLARLVLTHNGKEVPVALSATLGRDHQCDITVRDRMASRGHALIERRKDKFFLSDRSSNGTYVHMPDGEHFLLHREEMMLSGSGLLSFGHPYQEGEESEVVRFLCEETHK